MLSRGSGTTIIALLVVLLVNLPLIDSLRDPDADVSTLLVVTLVLDLLLVLVAVVFLRRGGRRRAPLSAVALEDVTAWEPAEGDDGGEVLLRRLVATDYVVRGRVVETADGAVGLDLGNRDVRVLLDGHGSRVAVGQVGQVRARLIG